MMAEKGHRRSEPGAMAMERCYDAMLKSAMAMERLFVTMTRWVKRDGDVLINRAS